ncbi:Cip1p PWA37_003702 [Arxiozyma heterogenica]|uniref:Cip1p n=1 Tax=Arxiozyma heterogenica TaxID=278026 RepID=UPI002F122FC6
MLLLDKYQKKFHMFSNKHNNNNNNSNINSSDTRNTSIADTTAVEINNDTNLNNNSCSNNNNNVNDCTDTSTPDMSTFVDPRLQYNMITPVTSHNVLFSINNTSSNHAFYNLQQPQQFGYSRYNGSTTSLASSINSDIALPMSASLNNMNMNNILSKQFINLLIDTYQVLCSDPTITPFDTNNPPSGILNRVGKLSLKRASSVNMEIFSSTTNSKHYSNNHNVLLSIIRHNLLSEIRKDGYYSRNVSLTSLMQPSLLNNNYNNSINSPLSQPPILKRTNTMDRVQNNIYNITGSNNPTSISTESIIINNNNNNNNNNGNSNSINNSNNGGGGLGIGLGSSIHLNLYPGLANSSNNNMNNNNNSNTNFNPLLSRSLSRTSSPLMTKTKNL